MKLRALVLGGNWLDGRVAAAAPPTGRLSLSRGSDGGHTVTRRAPLDLCLRSARRVSSQNYDMPFAARPALAGRHLPGSDLQAAVLWEMVEAKALYPSPFRFQPTTLVGWAAPNSQAVLWILQALRRRELVQLTTTGWRASRLGRRVAAEVDVTHAYANHFAELFGLASV